jgi:hypothetical protein
LLSAVMTITRGLRLVNRLEDGVSLVRKWRSPVGRLPKFSTEAKAA